MLVDKVSPIDPRVSRCEAILNGQKYHYLIGLPDNGKFKATIFLIHGWPDLSIGWRYQIPSLIEYGMRVVVPDMIGYGGTNAPQVPPADLRLYSIKRAADDISELARQLKAPSIILGGHDWGGFVVYRTAQWYPELVTHVFSVCTPYAPPTDRFISASELADGPLPQFRYQIQLAGPEVEANIRTRDEIRQFLKGLYGGKSEHGRPCFRPESGVDFEELKTAGASPLLDGQELEFYVNEYMRHGMHGPLNWYRTRRINFEDDLKLKSKMVKQPVLFIAGKKDNVLTPEMSRGMETFVPHLRRKEVNTGHWALTQAPAEVNGMIKEWLEQVVFRTRSSL